MRTPEVQPQVVKKQKIAEETPKRVPVSAHSSDSGSYDDTNMDKHHDGNTADEEDALKFGDFGQLKGPAKALYDYLPIEGDEIELKKGNTYSHIS